MVKDVIIFVDPKLLVENMATNIIYSSQPENFDRIKENIRMFGIQEPLIVDPENVIISGNIRRRIAIELKIDQVPVIYRDRPEINPQVLSITHAQQRIKTYSEILEEVKILEANYPVGRGCRTDLNPEMKKNQEMRKSINVSDSKLNKLKNIDKYAKELFRDNPEQYKKLWNDIDTSKKSVNKTVATLKQKVEAKENLSVVPKTCQIYTENIKIYHKSCANMEELADKSVSTIVTSPPYFHMRDYGTGDNQRGLEDDVKSFIKGLVDDFKDCKRVLKDDGSLWVNLGEALLDGTYNAIPHRFAIAMMEEGWLLNDEIVWTKSNARFTAANRSVRAHEYIFHFVRSKNFYYNNSWLNELDDVNNKLSLGTKASMVNLKSWMDCKSSMFNAGSNNMDDLRKACKENGINLTHTAAFPVIVPLLPILLTSKVGDTVIDTYNGTGSTGQAAVENGRKYVGYEVKSEYIMISKVRLRDHLESDDSIERLAA